MAGSPTFSVHGLAVEVARGQSRRVELSPFRPPDVDGGSLNGSRLSVTT
jgi:hypothetical protein